MQDAGNLQVFPQESAEKCDAANCGSCDQVIKNSFDHEMSSFSRSLANSDPPRLSILQPYAHRPAECFVKPLACEAHIVTGFTGRFTKVAPVSH